MSLSPTELSLQLWPQKAVGHPYGSQFSLGTSWHSGFSFHGPSKTSTCSSLQHFSLLQWRALVEHHCRQSSFRIVSHFQLHVPFHQFNQCWFPYLSICLCETSEHLESTNKNQGRYGCCMCTDVDDEWVPGTEGKSPSDQIKIFGVSLQPDCVLLQRHLSRCVPELLVCFSSADDSSRSSSSWDTLGQVCRHQPSCVNRH